MRIFVFEWTTGGGLLAGCAAGGDQASFAQQASLASLAMEGAAMLTAVATDFAAIPGAQVAALRDVRFALPLPAGVDVAIVNTPGEFDAAFDSQARRADWTVVIAPECEGLLVAHAQRVVDCGGRLLGCGDGDLRLTSDKHATCQRLAAAGVNVPSGGLLDARGCAPPGLRYPIVVKPRDGAGSQGVRRIDSPPLPSCESHVGQIAAQRPVGAPGERCETYCEGLPASVAFLCGPARRRVALAPCRQLLGGDGRFAYQGGSLPLPATLARRATDLASRTVDVLDAPLGFLGVDLVLGADEDGRDDYVIEINPRFTTSYVGLRAAARENLAEAMLTVASGRNAVLTWSAAEIEFRPDGRVIVPAST